MDYRTQSGDTLFGIAAKFHIGLAALEAANPQIANPDLIFPNEMIHVPAPAGPAHRPTPIPPPVVTYLVQPGDTMSGIASAHHLTLASLIAGNPQIADPNLIHPGDVLNISGMAPAARKASAPTHVAGATISTDAVTYGLYAGGGDVGTWTAHASQILGVPADIWVAGYEVLCRRESSGRANAINDWDSNAHGPIQADGYPLHCSRGVAQCIPDTFAAHHMSGTSTGIYDPVANIAASMHYVMSRYGVVADGSNLAGKVQQADPNRGPLGY